MAVKERQALAVARAMEEYSDILKERDELKACVTELEHLVTELEHLVTELEHLLGQITVQPISQPATWKDIKSPGRFWNL